MNPYEMIFENIDNPLFLVNVYNNTTFTYEKVNNLWQKNTGYPEEKANGKEAYKMYMKHKPDLIFMDIVMPEVDGYQATGMIRQKNKKIPIIALTAKALKQDQDDCFQAGMDDYLSKPVSLSDLKNTLEKFL